VTPVGEADSYAAAWSDLITWRRWYGGLFLAWAPVNVLVMIALGVLCSAATAKRAMLPAGLVTFAFIVVAGLRLSAVKCPRCGKAFVSLGWMQCPFTSDCVHCQLPEGSADPSASLGG